MIVMKCASGIICLVRYPDLVLYVFEIFIDTGFFRISLQTADETPLRGGVTKDISVRLWESGDSCARLRTWQFDEPLGWVEGKDLMRMESNIVLILVRVMLDALRLERDH